MKKAVEALASLLKVILYAKRKIGNHPQRCQYDIFSKDIPQVSPWDTTLDLVLARVECTTYIFGLGYTGGSAPVEISAALMGITPGRGLAGILTVF